MFYSPKMLGKKGPMGTVWMAAHLERKIKKNQIEKINITVCAERLLFPEAPIALRMSAHLLLGLVRIYAWKVNHTYDDCNRLLTNVRTAYVMLKVIDLPADAHRAPPQSITLPSNFQLDDIDLDDLADDAGGLDAHQKTFDQITITSGSGEENYVRFLIDENDSSSTSNRSTRSAGPMDDMLPPCSDHMQELITNAKSTEGASAPYNADEAESQFHDAYMDNNQFERAPDENQDIPNENQSDEFHDILRGSQFDIPNEIQYRDIPNENTSDAIPNENQLHDNTYENLEQHSPIEQLRSLHPTPPIVGNSSIDATCQFSASPNENSNDVRGSFTPVELQLDAFPEEIILVNQNVPRQSPQNNDIPSPRSANTEQDKVELAVAPSPPRVREKRKRKKQQFYFDKQIVLSNKKMKEQLKDSAAALLVRKRRRLPSSPLDLWMYQRAHLKDQIFDRPLINWKFASLAEKKTYPPIINEQPDMDPPLSPPQQFPDNEVIIEEPADNEVIIEEPADPPVGFQQSPHHDMGTVKKPPVNSPVGPSHLSPNHNISTEEPSRNPPPGDQYPSPNNDMYIEEPTIYPRSPTQLMPIDANEQPDRLRCQQVNETMQGQSPLVEGSWNTPNSNNNLFNSPSNTLPIFEPEVVNSTHSSPAKHTWPVSQSPSTPSHEKRDAFRTPPLKRSAEREDLNFLETPPSIKAKRARIEDGNLSPSVLLENDSARRERNSWSARSMGMAKYLREHLAVDPNAGDQNGNISLNQILEGKTRKHCARMFFETLVLTTSNYIQVKQEEAYADVLITPRARLTGMKDRDIPS